MKLNTYSIFDTASGLYSRPFFTQSDGEAIRSFGDIANDTDHPIGKHPEHYTLLRVGIFDDATAKLTDEMNSSLLTGLEAVAQTRMGEDRPPTNSEDVEIVLENDTHREITQ